MATAKTSPNERNAMLRRVAIVLSSLPDATRTRLLGSIGPQFKSEVSRVLAQLDDVDPLEKRRAIQAFRVSLNDLGAMGNQAAGGSDEFVRSSPSNRSTGGLASNDTASVRSPARRNSPPTGTTPTNSVLSGEDVTMTSAGQSEPPLAFMADLDDPSLVAILNAETPQTIAIVLSSLPPEKAAGLLHQLSPALQRQTVVRLSKLTEVSEFASSELASHFHNLLERRSQSRGAIKPSSNAVLEAILAAMPQPTATANAAATPPKYVAAPTAAVTNVTSTTTQGRGRTPSSSENSSARDLHRPDTGLVDTALGQAIQNLHQVIPDSSGSHSGAPRATSPIQQNNVRVVSGPYSSSFQVPSVTQPQGELSTDQIEKRLTELTPTQLCNALARVNTRKAVLALCGMSVAKVDAALPKPIAASVRQQMMSLQTINLREIDDAKAEVAAASFALASPTPAAAAA
jgi:flagellar motor switch protein FliG